VNAKKQRREAAQKKSKQRLILIFSLCTIILIGGAAAGIIYAVTRPATRVFSVASGHSVTLYEDGRFTANLFHNVSFTGRYTEETAGDETIISFTHGGGTVTSQIHENGLLLPVPWRANCRAHSHEIIFPRVR